MILKTISLWQPWASLLVGGYKKYETRSWTWVGGGSAVVGMKLVMEQWKD